jgi:hypothetical protein
MTKFKVGNWIVPKNKEQKEAILWQAHNGISFPCRVIDAYESGSEQFLQVEDSNGESLGLYAYRFKLDIPNKSLDDYM